jgi:hypothetical protein
MFKSEFEFIKFIDFFICGHIAIIIPDFKKGSEKDPKNYRGLPDTCYKIYSEILNEELKVLCENF